MKKNILNSEYIYCNNKKYKIVRLTSGNYTPWMLLLKPYGVQFDIVEWFYNGKTLELEKFYILDEDYKKITLVESHIVQYVGIIVKSGEFESEYSLFTQKEKFLDRQECFLSFFALPIEKQNEIITEYQISNL